MKTRIQNPHLRIFQKLNFQDQIDCKFSRLGIFGRDPYAFSLLEIEPFNRLTRSREISVKLQQLVATRIEFYQLFGQLVENSTN